MADNLFLSNDIWQKIENSLLLILHLAVTCKARSKWRALDLVAGHSTCWVLGGFYNHGSSIYNLTAKPKGA